MSAIIEQAVAALAEKLGSSGFDGSAKFSIEGEGGVIIDAQGVRSGDEETEVTLIADADDLDPTSAFMGGRLHVEGDMGTAMRLSGLF
jgi:putative sterol carrier protein